MNSHESPWVFFFSKFSSEALLFEALVIFTLLAIYAAFFVLRKRRFGSVKTQIPAGVVKAYLNELIGDAESLRAQLFGLLYSAGVPAAELNHLRSAVTGASGGISAGAMLQATQAGGGGVGGDPAAVAALEAKLAEQAKQIETFLAEKTRIAQELEEAKNKGGSGGGSNQQDLNKLQEKIGLLEGKLAEYSVIEDDLANLKRLQQENAQLKSQLGGKAPESGVSAPTPAAASPNVAASPAAAAAAAPGVSAGGSEPTENSLDDALASLTSDAAATAAAPQAPVSGTGVQGHAPPEKAASAELQTDSSGSTPLDAAGGFEALVDNVEKSLEKPAEEAAAAAPPSTTEVPSATIEKSDADLVAEFEKMLKG